MRGIISQKAKQVNIGVVEISFILFLCPQGKDLVKIKESSTQKRGPRLTLRKKKE
jgi:hypothetical protein